MWSHSQARRNYLAAWLLGLSFFLVVVLLVAWVWPYNKLQIDLPDDGEITNGITTGRERVVTDDYLHFVVEFCNEDVDVLSERWVDIYTEFSVFESDSVDQPVGSIRLPDTAFFPASPECGAAEVEVILPDYIPDGTLMRLRSRNTYQANLLARPTSVTYETGFFRLERT